MPRDGRTNEQDHAHDRHAGVLAAAIRVVSGLTLLSRFAGLARDVVTARIFGDEVLASAFRAAYALPNLFRRLFGEGALSAAFLPEYTQLRRAEPRIADELADITLRLLTLATGGLTLVVELLLAVVLWLAPADADRVLSIKLMMLMLPMMPMVCITAILGGMLQAHGRFGPPAAAPIILNVFQILAGAWFYFGWTHEQLTTAYLVGGAAVIASVVQIVWSLLALRGLVRWRAAGEAARKHGKAVFSRFIPAVLGLGTLQLNTMMDMVIAMWPVWIGPTAFGMSVTLDRRSNAILSYTQALYQFPLGVFGIAVATAVFPMLARAASDVTEFTGVLHRGLRLSLFIGLPASLGLILVRNDLIFVIYSGGKAGFTAEGVERSAAVLLGFAPGVWAYSLNHVLTRAFYARHDTRTPMRIAMAMVGLNFILNVSLIWPLREAGLAWSTAISAVTQTVVLASACRSRLGVTPFDRSVLASFARISVAAAMMGVSVWAVQHVWHTQGWTHRAERLGASVVVGAIAYAGAVLVMRLPEAKWLMQRGHGAGGQGLSSMSFD